MFGTCQHAMASSQAMKQSSLDLNLSTKKTRKQELLAQMDLVVPWAALVELITPYYCQSASNSFQVSASKFFQLLRLI